MLSFLPVLCAQRGEECSPFSLFRAHNEAKRALLSPIFQATPRRRAPSFLPILPVHNEAKRALLSSFFGRNRGNEAQKALLLSPVSLLDVVNSLSSSFRLFPVYMGFYVGVGDSRVYIPVSLLGVDSARL